MSWYTLVFLTLAFAVITFAAIMTHIPRLPEQRGLLAIILIAAFNALWALLVTQVTDPAKGIEVSRTLFDILVVMLALAILAGLLDFFFFVQARRRRLEGAEWSLIVGIALIACAVYGLLAQFGTLG